MKLLLIRVSLSLGLLHFSSVSFAQTITQQLTTEEIANRITSVYGSDFLSQNPELLIVYGKLLNQSIEYVVASQTTDEKFPLLSSVPLNNKANASIQGANFPGFDITSFNPLAYQIEFFSDRTKVFRIDNTDYLMVVNPIKLN